MTTHRTIPELEAYAQRLHRADPNCTEAIPVTPEEAFVLQERHLLARRLTDRNCFNVDELNLLGHRLRIL